MKRALLSVSDKTGLVELAQGLVAEDYEIISTGGTAKKLRDSGIQVMDVSEVTNFPEMMDGRVKTLHPAIHGGLLALRDKAEHMAQIKEQEITPIDLVVVNLYPFAETIKKEGVTLAEAIENIDIGGPSMIRSAAKNYQDVAVVTDPKDYQQVLKELKENQGEISKETKQKLAVKAFKQTANYDQMIYNYLAKIDSDNIDELPAELNLNYIKKMDLRYGENPHQKAAFYQDIDIDEASITTAKQLAGKELSFNNINDTNGALELVKEFTKPACAVIKHANPCGLAEADDLLTAYEKAYAGDPLSAFGSIIALNRKVDAKTATAIAGPDKFVEVVIAPDYEEKAIAILKERWQNLRILQTGDLNQNKTDKYDLKKVTGGLLVQDRDLLNYIEDELKVVTKRKPTEQEMKDLLFAWTAVKHVKSNAIVLAREQSLVGVGAGQMSRVDSMIIAARKAGERKEGSVVGSDAFFPFKDAIEEAAKNGATAIIQPGGSVRDEEVIKACDEHNIAMVFTGYRHFKH